MDLYSKGAHIRGGRPVIRGFTVNTLAVYASPTRDKSGDIGHTRTRKGQVLAGQQQFVSYKCLVKDGSGRGVTLLPGTTFLHVNRPLFIILRELAIVRIFLQFA